MLNPWVILAVVGVWLGSVVGVGAWQHSQGVNAERAVWEHKETSELSAANALITNLQNIVNSKEAVHQKNLAEISKKYQQGIKDAELEKTKFITSVRNGTTILRQPTMPKNSSGSSSSKTESSSIGCDGKTGSELQLNTSEFLYSESIRANKIVEQLSACQEIVIKDRELCGNPL